MSSYRFRSPPRALRRPGVHFDKPGSASGQPPPLQGQVSADRQQPAQGQSAYNLAHL